MFVCLSLRVAGREVAQPADVGSDKVWRHPRAWDVSLSHSCTIKLAPSVAGSLPRENYSELPDKISSKKSGVSRLRVLIG